MIKPVYDKGLIFTGLCFLQIQAYFLIQGKKSSHSGFVCHNN